MVAFPSSTSSTSSLWLLKPCMNTQRRQCVTLQEQAQVQDRAQPGALGGQQNLTLWTLRYLQVVPGCELQKLPD